MSRADASAAELSGVRESGIHPLTLRFRSPVMEAAFQDSWRTAAGRTNRIWAFCAFSYYIAIIVVLGVLDPEFLLYEQPVRLFVCLPLLTAEFVISLRMIANRRLLDASFLISATMAMSNASISHFMVENSELHYFLLMEMAVTFVFSSLYFRARLSQVLLFCALVLPVALASIVSVGKLDDVAPSALAVEMLIVAFLAITVVANVYSREMLARRNYREMLTARSQLHNAEKLADEAVTDEVAKSRFIRSVGSEFDLPVSRVIAAASSDGPTSSNERAARYLANIENSAQRLRRIIDQVVAAASKESRTADPISVPVHTLLMEAASRNAGPAEAAGISLTTTPQDGSVICDPYRAAEVMDHILSNAIKFSPAGGTVELGARMEPDGRLALIVADRGPGIPDESITAVREPFVQLDDGLNRQHEGLGLGLALAQTAAASCHGELELLPRDGGGLEARLVLATHH